MMKPYRKPELIKVPLRPEEAVLTGCKVTGASAGPGNPCGSNPGCSSSPS